MGEVGEEVDTTFVAEKNIKESSMNLETASANVRERDEAIEATTVSEVLPE